MYIIFVKNWKNSAIKYSSIYDCYYKYNIIIVVYNLYKKLEKISFYKDYNVIIY